MDYEEMWFKLFRELLSVQKALYRTAAVDDYLNVLLKMLEQHGFYQCNGEPATPAEAIAIAEAFLFSKGR